MMKLTLKFRGARRDVWGIDNDFSLQHLELSHEEAVELYNQLGEALAAVTNAKTPSMNAKAIEYTRLGTWDGKLRAVKEAREYNDISLKQAKDLVEVYMSDNNIPTP